MASKCRLTARSPEVTWSHLKSESWTTSRLSYFWLSLVCKRTRNLMVTAHLTRLVMIDFWIGHIGRIDLSSGLFLRCPGTGVWPAKRRSMAWPALENEFFFLSSKLSSRDIVVWACLQYLFKQIKRSFKLRIAAMTVGRVRFVLPLFRMATKICKISRQNGSLSIAGRIFVGSHRHAERQCIPSMWKLSDLVTESSFPWGVATGTKND